MTPMHFVKTWPKSEPWKRSYLGSWSKRRESQSLWSYQPGEAFDKPGPFVIRCHERTVRDISPHLPCHWWYLRADKARAAVKGKSEPLSAHTWAAEVPAETAPGVSEGTAGEGGCCSAPRQGTLSCSPGSTALPPAPDHARGGSRCEEFVFAALTFVSLWKLGWKGVFFPDYWENLITAFLKIICRLSPGCSLLLSLASSVLSWEVASQATEPTKVSDLVSFPCAFPGVE